MKEIREAILDKVRAEAREIVEQAEAEAARIVAEARERREEKLAAEKERQLREARAEAAQIIARGAMDARNAVASAKAQIFADIVEKARAQLRSAKPTEGEYARLIAEAITGLGGGDGITLAVPKGCGDLAKTALAQDEEMKKRVAQVEERAMEGGVVAESEDKSLVVDNTFSARLEMLLPRIYVLYSAKLFGEGGAA